MSHGLAGLIKVTPILLHDHEKLLLFKSGGWCRWAIGGSECLGIAVHGMELIIGVVDPRNASKSVLQHLSSWNLRVVCG
jgi:hypothetical protein